MNALDWTQTIASIATAAGVLLAAWQLRIAKHQAISSFEDALAREYREIVRHLPTEALLGQPLIPEVAAKHQGHFFWYIDLSNEQVFLRQQRRVSRATWAVWSDGIRANLHRSAFNAAWESIKRETDGSFQELRRLEAEAFATDPVTWGKSHISSAARLSSARRAT